MIEALRKRVKTDGARPLVTHVDTTENSRVELSAITFANWVDKTCNLLDDEGATPGDPIALRVLASRPDHWVSLVWVVACWQFGSPFSLGHPADVTVVGPDEDVVETGVTIGCSLHPFGLALAKPWSGIDYRDVLAQPDAHWSNPAPDVPSTDGHTWEAICQGAVSARVGLSNPSPWDSVTALCRVIQGGGSIVLARGSFDASVFDQERVERMHDCLR